MVSTCGTTLVCLVVWFIRLVWFNQLNKTNQLYETDQTDQMNKTGWQIFPASCWDTCNMCTGRLVA